MSPRAGARGFTLFEALLALGLTVLLVTGLFVFYDQAAQTRDAVTEEMARVAARRRIMTLVTADLRAVLPGTGLSGGGDSLTVTASHMPGAAAWAEYNITETPLPPDEDRRVVTYRLRMEEDEDGYLFIVGVERATRIVSRPIADIEEENVRSELLSPQYRFLNFRFWDGYGWVDSWGGGDLPMAVEVLLGEEPLPEDTEVIDYPYETMRRVIYLPASRMPEAPPAEGEEGAAPAEGGGP